MRSALSQSGQETLPLAWEAFARLLDHEREQGPRAARQRLAGLRMAYLARRQETALPSLRGVSGDLAGELARTRGVWALWMLRQRLGAHAWEQLDFEGAAPISWEHLGEVASRVGGAEIARALEFWVASDALPDYRLERASARQQGEGFAVALRIVNRGEGSVPVGVAIRTEEGALHELMMAALPGQRADAAYPVLTRPAAAAVDPHGALLMAEAERGWLAVSLRPRWWPF